MAHYQRHFGLQQEPFALTPDPEFFFAGSQQQGALNEVLMALDEGQGFVLVFGEVGSGKTLLCRKLLDHLEEGPWQSAYLPNPLLQPQQLYHSLAQELGVEVTAEATVQHLVEQIWQQLLVARQQQKQVVVCVDEAQAMPVATLEALRLLSNLETSRSKLMHIVLFAQPELEQQLAQPQLRQLRQRIAYVTRLQALDRAGLQRYIWHRLQVAGSQGRSLFTPGALALIWRGSGGLPRLVNLVCHKALLAAYGQGKPVVGRRQVRAALRDSGLRGFTWPKWLGGKA